MDPVSLAGLGLGSASIVFQVSAGYDVFEDAVNMPKECESLRLRLRLECTRLLDWADLVGLNDQNGHATFDKKLKANRATVLALLSEMKTLIGNLHGISLRSDDVLHPPGVAGRGSHTAKQLHLANTKEQLEDINTEQFRSMLESFGNQLGPQKKHGLMKGWRRVVDIGRGAADIAKQPGRLRWALRDHEAFRTYLGRLKELTDFLHGVLGEHQMSVLLEMTKETCMAMLQMSSSIDEMRELLKAVEIAAIQGGTEFETRAWLPLGDVVAGRVASGDASFSAVATPGRRQTLFAQLTRFRYTLASLQDGSQNSGLGRLRLQEEQLNSLTIDANATRAYRVPATFMDEIAWVEWKTYRTTRYQDACGAFQVGPNPTVRANLERLVAMLNVDDRPSQFRVPLCAGYFDDEINQRFGLVYQVPGGMPQSAEIMPLSELLVQESQPSLQRRISLAIELVTSMYYLHAVNWLHKGLSSRSVIVLLQGGTPDYSRPYISGFECSRPDEADLTTTAGPDSQDWAVYVHPDYQGIEKKKYRKTFDMYSLGIILLEIALWKPAEDIVGFSQSFAPQPEESAKTWENPGTPGIGVRLEEAHSAGERAESPGQGAYSKASLQDLKRIRTRLLADEPALLERVRAAMGDRYHDAVRACIGGLESLKLSPNADETSGVIATLLQQAYLRLVVDVLRGIRV
ncbi:hypothetical protein PLICBS_007815 [Purpureocillium lilacinum]|uniref:uncharacterized protein n=1 Tax=Purpureocillium lilacinum TaxID=33203 RepID=UPI002088973A|nr:hypothetical protein PLICBS_007815 [Purpureocillium lilacinum]